MKLRKMLLTLTAAAVLALSIPFAALAVNGGETAPARRGRDCRDRLCARAPSPPRRGLWSP